MQNNSRLRDSTTCHQTYAMTRGCSDWSSDMLVGAAAGCRRGHAVACPPQPSTHIRRCIRSNEWGSSHSDECLPPDTERTTVPARLKPVRN
eukprot:1944043-Pyramimonas_sp.AAC.2